MSDQMTAEQILRDALEDAMSAFGLLEATLRSCRDEPTADIVMQFKNKASAALARADRVTLQQTEEKTP